MLRISDGCITKMLQNVDKLYTDLLKNVNEEKNL